MQAKEEKSKMTNSLLFLAVALYIPAQIWLSYRNYRARVKYKEFFRETNELWRKYDDEGRAKDAILLSVLLHCSIFGCLILFSVIFDFLVKIETSINPFTTVLF